MKRSEAARAVLVAAILTAVFVITWPLREYLLKASAPALPPEPSTESRQRYLEAVRQQNRLLAEGRQLAESFLVDVQAGRLEQTYDSWGIFFVNEEKIGREELVGLLRKQPAFRNPRPLPRTEIVDSPPSYVYYWSAETEQGKVIELEVWVARSEDGSFRVGSFVVDNAHVWACRPRDVREKRADDK